MKRLPRHLSTAIKIAESNDLYPKWKFGAIILKGGAVQAVGMNKLHTPASVASDEHLMSLSTHAENDALKRCGSTKGATIYVARVGRNGQPALARPCKQCRKLLLEAGIRRAIYTIGAHEFGILNF